MEGRGKGRSLPIVSQFLWGLVLTTMADLACALRLSISGDNIGVELPQDVGKVGEGTHANT